MSNKDKRFHAFREERKFRGIPKTVTKVKIDKRFQGVFKDSEFKNKYVVDKRGRPLNETSNEDLKRYYDLSSEELSSSSDTESRDAGKYVKAPGDLKIKSKHDSNISETVKKKLLDPNIDYARGESKLCSDDSSSDDEESSDELSDSETIEHNWGEFTNDAEVTEEATSRLAACNMDWDRIRAVDLMVLFNSFLTSGGALKSVVIYPSEFGKKRMQEEEVKGPIELVESKTKELADESEEEEGGDTEEGSKYHMEKLRQYQINRLKYYYAIATFDSPESANKVYTECDGLEYESSATKIDLRFVPDDMTFDDEPKETCDRLPESSRYEPRFFTTTALQQMKVDLTWDETDPNRVDFVKKIKSGKIEEIDKETLTNFIADSGTEESEIEDEVERMGEKVDDPADKYRALLQEITEKERDEEKKDVEMEVVWGNMSMKKDANKSRKEQVVPSLTPFEKMIEKRKEKNRERKASKKADESDSDSDLPYGVDLNDPYYKEELDRPEFMKNKKKNRTMKKDATDADDGDGDKETRDGLNLLLWNDDNDKNHFSLKKIMEQETENETKSKKKRKNKKKKQAGGDEEGAEGTDNFKLEIDDRFSALFTDSSYNIDPTNPNFKKTEAMKSIIDEKLKRKNVEGGDGSNEKRARNEVDFIVQKVSKKAGSFQSNKRF